MTQTEQLSGAALNLALAFAQGWRLEKVGARYIITAPDGEQQTYQKKAWAEARILKQVPDWSSDVGAALTLCLDVAREHPGSEWQWTVDILEVDSTIVARFTVSTRVYHGAHGDTPAHALARLALAALTQEAG